MNQDSELIQHAKSVLDATALEYGNELISAPALPFHPANLFAETHYALSALLLALLDSDDDRWLRLAESRLRLWDSHDGPRTFFNAMAVCLALIIVRRSGVQHGGLENILEDIVARTHEHRGVAYRQWAGNNCYLQQVAVDLVLLPIARGEVPTPDAISVVAGEFRRYRTGEGFFYDLPREGNKQEHLCPPTYVMKILFLLGICDEFHPAGELAELFATGIEAVRPLLTHDGNFSYFGRTDNSPFPTGLTIFDLRKGANCHDNLRDKYWSAAAQAEFSYRRFPRTPTGLLECNRFSDPQSPAESAWSRDMYAKIGEYSVASCAYALLGCYCFPAPAGRPAESQTRPQEVAQSRDLGLVKFSGPGHEIVLRTRSELTSWDRRYLGPTILRYRIGDDLLIGAISKTVASDLFLEDDQSETRLRTMLRSLRNWYLRGFDQLDATTVGFIPVIRQGPADYLPYEIASTALNETRLEVRYRMVKLIARGYGACAIELRERLRRRLPGFKQKEQDRPFMKVNKSIECVRNVNVNAAGCQIEDVISGDLKGKHVLLSTRSFPGASIRVAGLKKQTSVTGWGSDGRQTIDIYAGKATGSEFRYGCLIEPARRKTTVQSSAI